MALPLFRAQQRGGLEEADLVLRAILTAFRQVLLLTGCRAPIALRQAKKVITGELKDWVSAL